MPTTTRTKTQSSRTKTEPGQYARELEQLGVGIARGLPGEDRSEFVDRPEIGAGEPPRGAAAGYPSAGRSLSSELVDDVADRVLAAVGSVKLSGWRLIVRSAMR
jgi:hypothetical protein